MTPGPAALAALALLGVAGLGVVAALIHGLARRGRGGALAPATVLRRAGSYGALAALLAVAALGGAPGIAILVGVLGALGLAEWARLFDLPGHHRVAILVAHAVVTVAIAIGGVSAADGLVAGLVLVGATWPVLRADTGRAIRDLGFAAVGVALVSVLLVHAVALAVEHGEAGAALFVALAAGCAGADVGAFLVGSRFGRTPLAPRLSPQKTREGVLGGVAGAGVGLVPFLPALAPHFGLPFCLALIPLVAGGSVWGDLLESAAKREAGVKDAGSWLPGFGGILDRIDSLLVTVALGYWIARTWGAG